MKSEILLSLILSLAVACTSTTDETESENLNPEAGAPASVEAAKPETDVKEKASTDSNDIAAAVEAKLDAKAEAAAVQPAVVAEASSEKVVYPTTSLLNLRQGPGKSHPVARIARFGEAISITGEQKNTWFKTSEGLWVSSLFTAETKPDLANDPVPQAAPVVEAEAPKPVEVVSESVATPDSEEATAPVAP